jgi:hypothetical protein
MQRCTTVVQRAFSAPASPESQRLPSPMVNDLQTSDPLLRLDGARKARLAWSKVGRAVADGMRTTGDHDRKKFLQEAAQRSGYSANLLRRYAAVLAFVEERPAEERLPEEVVDRAFAGLELIMRIANYDAGLARTLFEIQRTKPLTVKSLRARLKDVEPKSATLERGNVKKPVVTYSYSPAAPLRQTRTDAAFSELRQALPKLSGKAVVAFGKPEGVAPVGIRCDAIAWLDRNFRTGDGFEIFHAPKGSSRAALSDAVGRAMLASTLFRKFFLVFTWDSESLMVDLAIESLEKFGADTVQVIRLGDMPFEKRKLREAKPRPDRRHMLPKICPNGKWA